MNKFKAIAIVIIILALFIAIVSVADAAAIFFGKLAETVVLLAILAVLAFFWFKTRKKKNDHDGQEDKGDN